eukprot:c8799_g1_i1.p1 GENE.c8799_g1_i1~~c8799_g1_i1.p1  ORF type:complete len:148 (+),score=26.42 c8799_g1_i1:111-554(+)
MADPASDRPAPPVCEGWLTKQGHVRKSLKRRFFKLETATGRLHYFPSEPGPTPEWKKAKGFIDLSDAFVSTSSDPKTLVVVDTKAKKTKSFSLTADTEDERTAWIASLTKAIEYFSPVAKVRRESWLPPRPATLASPAQAEPGSVST